MIRYACWEAPHRSNWKCYQHHSWFGRHSDHACRLSRLEHLRWLSLRDVSVLRACQYSVVIAHVGIVASGPAVTVEVDGFGVIVHVVGRSVDLFGWSGFDLVGRALESLIPERFREAHRAGFTEFLRTGLLPLEGRPLRLPVVTAGGGERELDLVLSSAVSGVGSAVCGCFDWPDRAVRDASSEVAREIAEVLSSERPFSEMLADCLGVLGTRLGWVAGAIWVEDPLANHLRAAAIWELVPGSVGSYRAALSVPLDPDGSVAGMVWRSSQPVWVDDLGTHGPNERRRAAAASDSLETGLFVPLIGGGRCVGVIELVDHRRRGMTIEFQETLTLLSVELGRLVAQRIVADTADNDRARVALALSARHVGMWSYHHGTGVVRWDEQMEQLYGLQPGSFESTFDAYATRIHDEDRPIALARIRDAIEQRRQFEYEYRVVWPDGSIAWIEGAGQPVIDQDGAFQGLTGICYDITPQVEARTRLEEGARHARLLADVGQVLVRESQRAKRLQRITEAVVEHLDAAFARIWTVVDTPKVLQLQASAGLYTHIDGSHASIAFGQLKIGRIASERLAHVSANVADDPHIADREWAAREGLTTFAGYPLVVAGNVVGVLALFARHTLTPAALATLEVVADTVSLGIDQSNQTDKVAELLAQQRRVIEERTRVAHVLQASLLPPSLPTVTGLRVCSHYRPGAEEVGGDFYDLFPLGSSRWGFMIGDVCGSGPEAATLTSLARHTMRTALMMGHAPNEALLILNEALLHADNDDRFCTAVCGELQFDNQSAIVTLSNGGHPSPLVLRVSDGHHKLPPNGPLTGVIPHPSFSQHTITLEPGDTIVMYTDGVTETRSQLGFYGEHRLAHLLDEHRHEPAETIRTAILDAVTTFDTSGRHDDLALLILQVEHANTHNHEPIPDTPPPVRSHRR